MADFSLTTVFVVPVGQDAVPSSGSTQDLAPGDVGIFNNLYATVDSTDIANFPYFYVAQGRTNTYLQGSKRSDKISGINNSSYGTNVTEWYKVSGCPTAANQITDVVDFTVQCGVIYKLNLKAPGNNPDNISFSTFFTFENVGGSILRITGKPLTKYGQPCDVAAFPFEYDRMSFRTFVYAGPATTADFIVADRCNFVAQPIITQRASYATGTSAEIAQLEKNFYSYQAGYLKHLYRMGGYNENFESWVSTGATYDTYYIKFNEYDKSAYQWGDYIMEDSTVIIAAPNAASQTGGATIAADIEDILEAALGTVLDNNVCITTTTTTSSAPVSTTTTTSTNIP